MVFTFFLANRKNYRLTFSDFLFCGIINFIQLFFYKELLIAALLVHLPYPNIDNTIVIFQSLPIILNIKSIIFMIIAL